MFLIGGFSFITSSVFMFIGKFIIKNNHRPAGRAGTGFSTTGSYSISNGHRPQASSKAVPGTYHSLYDSLCMFFKR
jgi:hypothetical protein